MLASALTHRETPRLRLRLPRAGDVEPWSRWLADPDTVRWLGQAPASKEEAWRVVAMMLGHWQLRGFGPWVVEERSTGRVVGRGGLWQPEGWPGAEYIILLDGEARGTGYATELGREVLHCAFELLGLPEVLGFIHPANAPSNRLAHRLGFTHRGHWQPQPGVLLNTYAFTREAYEAQPR